MRKTVMLSSALLVIAMQVVSVVSGADYYVSPTGSASWSQCTNINTPCSLATANNNLIAGDTAYLRGGTYTLTTAYQAGIQPKNSGNASNRITYAAMPGETPVITQTSGITTYGILLQWRNYIKITGITFRNIQTWAYIWCSSSYNEIANCKFISEPGYEAGVGMSMVGGLCAPDHNNWVTHNWIHNNTFSKRYTGNPCGEATDILKIGGAPTSLGPYPAADNYNTIEDNYFEYAAHSIIDNFGMYNVFKNNIMHNEPWIDGCTDTIYTPIYENSSYNGKHGHRNMQLSDFWERDATYALVEGNRIGHASTNPGNAGPINLDVAAPKNIVRYNYIFNGMQSGVYFKYAGSSPGDWGYSGGINNRIYSNTIYHHGYGYDWNTYAPGYFSGHGIAQWTYSGATNNVIKNNIVYDNKNGDICGLWDDYPCNPMPIDTVTNNWLTSNGEPKFVNPDVTRPGSSTLPDLSLQSSSGAINGGIYLTTAVGSGTNSRTLAVQDALYFQDGTWGSDLARGVTLFPDWIAIGTVTNTVQITSINYDTNTITLASPMTWSNGAPIWLYKKSDGAQVLYGSAPDYGAYEYSGTVQQCTGYCCPSGYTCSQPISGSGCSGTCCASQSYCTSATQCPNGICGAGETCSTCPQDCGACSQYFLPEQYVEAESATLASPMQTGSNSSASGGQCIYTTTVNQGSASYTFQIGSPGKYRMEARVLSNSPDTAGANSFYVGLDNEPAQGNDTYTYDTLQTSAFAWDNVSLRSPLGNVTWSQYDPMLWDVTQGLHTFTFYGRESNTWLDQIILRRACGHRSDSSCDGCVSDLELFAFIDRWKLSNVDVTLRELIEAMGLWKRGGC